jgi:hypothetical protein
MLVFLNNIYIIIYRVINILILINIINSGQANNFEIYYIDYEFVFTLLLYIIIMASLVYKLSLFFSLSLIILLSH